MALFHKPQGGVNLHICDVDSPTTTQLEVGRRQRIGKGSLRFVIFPGFLD
jgi:hypothetical protein